MNKIQEEHWEEIPMSYNMDEKLNNHFDITIKHMKGFAEWTYRRYIQIPSNKWRISDINIPERHDIDYTTEQLIEEYIKQL